MPGRLVVRRIPDLNPAPGQDSLFDTWRFHAFFTTSTLDTVTADKIHRGHAIIEQVHADLKHSALAHLPSGRFCANAAWLVLAVMAFNLTRTAATLTGPALAKATTATIRRKLITVPARIASLSPPDHPPPAAALALGNRLDHPLHPSLRTTRRHTHDHPAGDGATKDQEHPGSEARRTITPSHQNSTNPPSDPSHQAPRWIEAKALCVAGLASLD